MAQSVNNDEIRISVPALKRADLPADLTGSAGPDVLSPLDLAFVGDAVCTLVFRTMAAGSGARHVEKMHQFATRYVNAGTQSAMMRFIQPPLTEEEHHIYKRGRNSKPVTRAKHQNVTDYRRATGYEALLGYLYLVNDWDRLMELIRIGYEGYEREERQTS